MEGEGERIERGRGRRRGKRGGGGRGRIETISHKACVDSTYRYVQQGVIDGCAYIFVCL